MVVQIQKVAVVGAGAMGRQIALNTAIHGVPTALYDVNVAQLEAARSWTERYLAERVSKGRMTPEQTAAARGRISFVPDLKVAVTDVDLIIEAVVEDLQVKQSLFAELDRLALPHTILASNSSTIVSSRIATATQHPERVANLHYFNPALVMQVVEVVQGPHTDPDVAQSLVDFCLKTGKEPIWMKKEIFGFVANRLLHALRNEALFLLENGYATYEEIDLACEKALGHPMGPFRLMDLTGIDVAYQVRMQLYRDSGREADKPPRIIAEKFQRGELGRKTGHGWYTYDP